MYVYVYIYMYIYIYIYITLGVAFGPPNPARHSSNVHPIRYPRFGSFRTQTSANLATLPIKQRFPGNPTLGTNLGQRILGMRTGRTTVRSPLFMRKAPFMFAPMHVRVSSYRSRTVPYRTLPHLTASYHVRSYHVSNAHRGNGIGGKGS